MDSGACAKSLRNPDLRTNQFGHRKDFFQGGVISRFFHVVAKYIFPAGPAVVKFYFTSSKLRKKKFQISNSRRSKAPCISSDAHANEDNYVDIRQSTLAAVSYLACARLGLCNRNSNFRLRLRLHRCKSFGLRFQLQSSKIA